jgi:hypothetical protein
MYTQYHGHATHTHTIDINELIFDTIPKLRGQVIWGLNLRQEKNLFIWGGIRRDALPFGWHLRPVRKSGARRPK